MIIVDLILLRPAEGNDWYYGIIVATEIEADRSLKLCVLLFTLRMSPLRLRDVAISFFLYRLYYMWYSSTVTIIFIMDGRSEVSTCTKIIHQKSTMPIRQYIYLLLITASCNSLATEILSTLQTSRSRHKSYHTIILDTKQTASKQNNTHKMVRDNQSDSSYNGGYSNDVEPDKKLNASLWNNNFGNKHHYSNNNNHNNSGCISINSGRKLLLLILELLVISCLLLFVLALTNLILILPSNSIWLAN